jgi:hypothetical protein
VLDLTVMENSMEKMKELRDEMIEDQDNPENT